MQKNGMNKLCKYSMTTMVNEHKFRVKLVSMSGFLQVCARKQEKGREVASIYMVLTETAHGI